MTEQRLRYEQSASAHMYGWSKAQASTAQGNYVTIPLAPGAHEEMVMKAFNTFVTFIQAIPTVEQVRGQVAGTYLHLVIYMSESSLEERYKVYEAEMQLYEQFPDLRLEFDLIDRKGYPVEYSELTGKLIEVIRELPDRVSADEIL